MAIVLLLCINNISLSLYEFSLSGIHVQPIGLFVENSKYLSFLDAISDIDIHGLNLSAYLKTQIGRIDSMDYPGELSYLAGGRLADGDRLDGPNLLNDFRFLFACRYCNQYEDQP